MEQIIGLDIGGTKCSVVLANVESKIEIIDKIKFATPEGFELCKNKLIQSIHEIINRNKVKIAGIGVSCGGPLNSKTGIILSPPNLPEWINVPIVSILKDEFKCPTFLQNDAKACALVEWKFGAGKGTDNMIFLTMGTGMGSGIISNGCLLTGVSDMCGEVGHIRLEKDGPVGFGKAGSFEGFCSGGGIGRLAKNLAAEALAEGKPFEFCKTPEEIDLLTTEILADMAKKGDPDAVGIFTLVGEKLGSGIAYLVDILNPEIVVIGSIFVRCESLLREAMENALRRECIPYSIDVCKVLPAQTGEIIGDLAGVMVAAVGLNHAFENRDADESVVSLLETLIKRYPSLSEIKDDIWKAYALMEECYIHGGKLLCCGNGGSAADADHIVGELMKSFLKKREIKANDSEKAAYPYITEHLEGALPAISLTQHTSLSTAYLNDVAPDMVFAQQLYGYSRPGDVLVAISTSGNSANVVRAAETARFCGVKSVALSGASGGKLYDICDISIRVPSQHTPDIQELHLPIYHCLCAMLEARFF